MEQPRLILNVSLSGSAQNLCNLDEQGKCMIGFRIFPHMQFTFLLDIKQYPVNRRFGGCGGMQCKAVKQGFRGAVRPVR